MPTAESARLIPSDDVLSRLGMEVPLSRVDGALRQIWEQDNAKTRASLMNFAIYSEDPAELTRNAELLERLTAEHACRAMLILCLPGSGPQRARAWINALCRPYQGQQTVCSEQITFLLEGGDAAQVQNIVFAHLDSDLPLVVWWQDGLTSNFEERFYSVIDTLIFDSSTWADPEREFAALQAARESDTADFDVRDLSWTRSHFLRLALAGCFQDARALEHLPQVDQIEIKHACGQRTAALLLAAWVATRLGATLPPDTNELVFQKTDGSPLRVVLLEEDHGPALHCLTLSGPCVRAQVRRDSDSAYVHMSAACEGHSHEEVLPADLETEADLISDQLSRAGGISLFGGLLPTVRQMLRAVG